jgi:hypothetical protein
MTTQTLQPLQRLQIILGLLPQINGIVLNSLGQINQLLPQAGLPAISTATLDVVNKSLKDALTLAGDLGVEIEGLLNLGMTFATGVQGLISQIHGQVQAPTPPVAAP